MKFLKLITIFLLTIFFQKDFSNSLQICIDSRIKIIEFWQNEITIGEIRKKIQEQFNKSNFRLQYVFRLSSYDMKNVEDAYIKIEEMTPNHSKIQEALGVSSFSDLNDNAIIISSFLDDIQINVIDNNSCCCTIQ